MANFTLKVFLSPDKKFYYSDDRHFNGGFDVTQIEAFRHLVPEGFIASYLDYKLFNLAELHNWKVQVTRL